MKNERLRDELHDLALQQIAQDLFNFQGGEIQPGVLRPTWRTYVNVGTSRQMPVSHMWLGDIYPDIVLVDTARSNVPMIIAEVETEETVNSRTADTKWKSDTEACYALYLFVPKGLATKAANIILDFHTVMRAPRAMYTYEFDEKWNLLVTPT